MTTAFRRKISRYITSPMKVVLGKKECSKLDYQLAASLRLSKSKDNTPKFEISWKDLVKLKPDLDQRLHPNSLFTSLKSQDYPADQGIIDVEMKETSQTSFEFSVDKKIFRKVVLLELANNFDKLSDRSCFFFTEVPEHIVVDYSSPNIAKPFHFGHFRSTIIGNVIVNLLRFVGHKVITLNYIGDWGVQYGILAAGYKKFGSDKKLKEDPLKHLYEIYTAANESAEKDPSFAEEARIHFHKMENGDMEALHQWQHFREMSLANLETTYEDLGIKFDEIHGESMYVEKSKVVLKDLLERNVATCESDSSVQADVERENGAEEKVVLRKSDGTSLYLTRDIAAAIDRRARYHFDKMYYVVDSSQTKHFESIFYLLKAMGCPWHEQMQHISFGRIHKFSTRKGNVVFLHDIQTEAQSRTLESMKKSPTIKVSENMEDIAFNLGISSLIVNDLSKRRVKEYEFCWDRILSMTSDSGYTLQSCHARLHNLKENCEIDLKLYCDLDLLVEPEATALIHHLARFDEHIFEAYKDLEPCALVHYLFELKQTVGRANKALTVKGQPVELATARLLLFHTAHLVMNKGLRLLGITPLDKM